MSVKYSIRKKRLVITLAALLSIPVALFLIMPPPPAPAANQSTFATNTQTTGTQTTGSQPRSATNSTEPASRQQVISPVVAVVNVSASVHQAQVQAYGEVKPTHQIQLAAEVSGRVTRLADNFASGVQLAAGATLATMESSSYQAAYLSMQKSLADAEVSLLQAERTSAQALQEWQQSGLEGEPDSPLVLNEPQLKAAQLAVTQQQAALAEAKHNLDNTQIRVPFEALVVSREVSVGSYLQPGSVVATLYSANEVEVRLLLSDAQWQLLPQASEALNGLVVQLVDEQNTEQQWQAQVVRAEQHIDSDSRQRALIVSVEQPLEKGLLPGRFVKARVSGELQKQVMSLPASALSQQGEVWYVDVDNHLQRFSPSRLFDDAGQMLIRAPAGVEQLQIVLRPLASYLPGMLVEIQAEQGT